MTGAGKSLVKGSGVADDAGVASAACVVGWDFGLCAPGEKFAYVSVSLDDRGLLRHLFDAYVYTGDELRVGERKISGACGLKLWILSFGDKENVSP